MIFTIRDEIFVNQYVHEIKSIEDLVAWFLSKDDSSKKDMVKAVFSLVIQSHPYQEELYKAIEISKVKKTATAVVMLTNPRKDYLKFGWEVAKLSGKELLNAWIILLNLLKIADTRRRVSENPKLCNHWWHKDLSNQSYIDKLLKEFKE